jgi:hypothetical protein
MIYIKDINCQGYNGKLKDIVGWKHDSVVRIMIPLHL